MNNIPKPPIFNTTMPKPVVTETPVEETPKLKEKKSKKRHTFFVVSLILIGLGAGLLGYYGYQTFIVEPQNDTTTRQSVEQLQEKYETLPQPTPTETPQDEEVDEDVDSIENAPIPARVGTYEDFGILYIPVLGSDYSALITAGDDTEEIYGGPTGVNYYPTAAMPAELGNFTLAGHRGYNGRGRFNKISTLNNGDSVYVETAEGWYKYSVTGHEVVKATQVEVLLPVPHKPEATPTKNIITLTSCYWDGNNKKRIAVYGDFVDFQPRSDGKPSEL